MKLFNYIALAGFAAANEVVTRSRRATGFSLTGDENPDMLMEILADITNGEVDDIEQALMAMMGVDRVETADQIRKFRTLKIMVLYLQDDAKFGKYCYYGCYCLPEGSHNIASGGYGTPLDAIDQSCFEFKQCYKCLRSEHAGDTKGGITDGVCAGENYGYAMDALVDADGNKYLKCNNKVGSCRRNICECDKALAEKLGLHQNSWDVSLHTNKGGFVREDNCQKRNGPGNQALPAKTCPCDTCPCPEECCGDKKTFPFNQPTSANKCCNGASSQPAGTC